jgi:hypothetical protein
MLSSPLRRCAVTGLVMPNNLMFALVPFASEDEQPTQTQSVIDQLKQHEASLQPPRRSRIGASWARRQAKPSLLKILQRARRMARHKAVTSQTVDSKAHFEGQVKVMDGQIAGLLRPRSTGTRHVVAKLGAANMRQLKKNGELLKRQGRATWITLEYSVVQTLIKQRKEKRFAGATDGIVEQISHQLEEDALTLLRKVAKSLGAKGHRHLLMSSSSPIASKYARSVIAAISLTDAEIVLRPNVARYYIHVLFHDQARRSELDELLRKTCCTTASDAALLVSQSGKTSELCIALWRLGAWRNGMAAAVSSSDTIDSLGAENDIN